jgi:hypothetical protein
LDSLWEYLLTGLRQCSDIHCVLLFVLFWTLLVAFFLLLFLLYRDTTHPLKDYSALNRVGEKAEKLQKSIRDGFIVLYDKRVEKIILRTFRRLLDRREVRNGSVVYLEHDGESLGRHYFYAFVYSLLSFLVLWLFYGKGSVGGDLGVEFLPAEYSWQARGLLCAYIALTGWLCYWIAKSDYFQRPLAQLFGTVIQKKSAAIAADIVGVMAGVGVGVIVIATAGFGAGDEVSAVWTFFFLLLPLINAIFDFLSTKASRILLKNLHEELKAGNGRKKMLLFLGHICLDLVLAFFFLGTLAFCLVFFTEWFDVSILSAGPDGSSFGMRAFLAEVTSHPFSSQNGWWAVLMLFSTLLPTFVHFIVALFAGFMSLAGAVLAWVEKQRKTDKDDHLLRTRVALLFFLPVVCFLLALYLLFWCWRLFRFIADPSFFAETAIGLANTHALVTAGVVIALAVGAYMAIKVLERWLSGETGGARVLAEERG